MQHARFAAGVVVVALVMAPPVEAQLSKAMATATATNKAAAMSQDKIDALSAHTRKMLEQYRTAIRKTQQLKVYNKELAGIVSQQRQRKASLAQRINGVSDLHGKIEPLMLRMIAGLNQFVENDLPFKRKQRLDKIRKLRDAMADPDKSIAAKFRLVLAAYQREAGYGHTLGTYHGELQFAGKPRLVAFLRVGRVMLFYLTPDGSAVGYYDMQAGRFKPLPASYSATIRQGIKVAKGQATPQLIQIAVPAPLKPGNTQHDTGEGS